MGFRVIRSLPHFIPPLVFVKHQELGLIIGRLSHEMATPLGFGPDKEAYC